MLGLFEQSHADSKLQAVNLGCNSYFLLSHAATPVLGIGEISGAHAIDIV